MKSSVSQYAIRLGHGFKTDVDKLALQVRSDLEIASHDRLQARKLAKHLGVKVAYPHQLPSVRAANLEGLGRAGEKQSWSALLMQVEGYPPLILTNPHHGPEREESNIFHELAHHLCGHAPARIHVMGGLPLREFDKEQEQQAEHLGFSLHINRESLFHCMKRGLSESEISERYCASPQLVKLRINKSGVKKILGLSGNYA